MTSAPSLLQNHQWFISDHRYSTVYSTQRVVVYASIGGAVNETLQDHDLVKEGGGREKNKMTSEKSIGRN